MVQNRLFLERPVQRSRFVARMRRLSKTWKYENIRPGGIRSSNGGCGAFCFHNLIKIFCWIVVTRRTAIPSFRTRSGYDRGEFLLECRFLTRRTTSSSGHVIHSLLMVHSEGTLSAELLNTCKSTERLQIRRRPGKVQGRQIHWLPIGNVTLSFPLLCVPPIRGQRISIDPFSQCDERLLGRSPAAYQLIRKRLALQKWAAGPL